MAIDDPISLSELLDVPDVRDAVRSFASMHGVIVSVVDKEGQLVTTTTGDESLVVTLLQAREGSVCGPDEGSTGFVLPLLHEGATIAKLAIGPVPGDHEQAGRVEAIGRHIAEIFEILIHNAYARHLTATLHTEVMEANFAELSAKNKRLAKAVGRMQEADRLKSSFLATMSHELRTPLTSVIGYSEMLIEGLAGAINDEQRDYLRTILSKADHLLQLISSILDVSMLESSSLEMHAEPITLRDMIDSVILSLGGMIRERTIVVEERSEGLPRVMGDSRQVRGIFRNLLANAIKFTEDGDEIHVALEIGAMKPDHVSQDGVIGVRIVVKDSGIGMTPEEQAQIFEPFYQVDSSSTREYGGSGLGLTLAKSYAEAHGGHIWVDSEPGSGSSFTVSLPAVREELRAYLMRRSPGSLRPSLDSE